jgi:PEP-CTERM motif
VKLKLKAALAASLALGTFATPASAVVTVTQFGGPALATFSVSIVGVNITINETWNAANAGGPIFLKFDGLTTGQVYNITKNITNNSGFAFTSMANELLDPTGQNNDGLDPNPQPGFVPVGYSTSNDNDGLSFNQGGGDPRTSSVFTNVFADEFTDVRDFLDFTDGVAANGAVFNVKYSLIDAGPNQPFLLAQRFNVRSTVVPEPGTWALMIAGFGFAGMQMRRRRTTVSYA